MSSIYLRQRLPGFPKVTGPNKRVDTEYRKNQQKPQDKEGEKQKKY